MDLLKAFDYVPHDLLVAKLAVYFVDENLLMYIYIPVFQIKSSAFPLIMYTAGFKMLFLGYIKGPLSTLHHLTVSLMTSFISSTKLVWIILLMITL